MSRVPTPPMGWGGVWCPCGGVYTYIHTYIPTYLPTYLRTYIHTYHYITLHYLTLPYITLPYIPYIHTYLPLHYLTLPYLTLPYIPYIHTYRHTYIPTITLHYLTLPYIPYIHTYTDTHTHTYIHSYIHTYIPAYIPTYQHTNIPTYQHTTTTGHRGGDQKNHTTATGGGDQKNHTTTTGHRGGARRTRRYCPPIPIGGGGRGGGQRCTIYIYIRSNKINYIIYYNIKYILSILTIIRYYSLLFIINHYYSLCIHVPFLDPWNPWTSVESHELPGFFSRKSDSPGWNASARGTFFSVWTMKYDGNVIRYEASLKKTTVTSAFHHYVCEFPRCDVTNTMSKISNGHRAATSGAA